MTDLAAPARAAYDGAVLATLFGDVPFGVALLDTEGRFVRVNPVFAAANGPSAEEHVGRRVEDVLADRGGAEVRALVDRVLATGEALPPEDVDVVDAQGRSRSWSTSWLPARDAEGRVVGVVAIGADSTGERQAEAARRAAEARSALLARTAELLDAGLDADEVSRRLCRLLVDSVCDVATVHLVEADGGIRFAGVAASDPRAEAPLQQLLERFAVSTDQPYGAGWSIATGAVQPLPAITREVLEAIAPEDPDFVSVVESVGAREGVVVPLLARGRVLGAVSITRAAAPLAPVDLDLSGVADVVRRAALVLDNALLYQRQSQISLALQRALLPEPPAGVAGLGVAVRYVPGVADLEVGGDFYDVLPLPDGTVGLVIGDVMGRGLHAAALMGQLRAALRAYAQLGLPPGQLLTLLDGLVAQLDGSALVTASYTVVDPARQLLTHASAGHLPPVMKDADGATALVEAPVGPPLGTGGAVHEAVQHPLPAGAVLVLCTDGLVEDRRRDIDVGLQALCDAVAGGPDDPDALADGVLAALGRVDRHEDDVALLVVRSAPVDEGAAGADEGDDIADDALLRLPPDPASVPAARHWVSERLTGAEEDRREVAVLAVTELVTNGVLHARTPLEVRLRTADAGLRVEVRDLDPAPPRRGDRGDGGLAGAADPGDEATTGRGTLLVDALTDRWGVDAEAGAKTVWFELGDPPAAPSRQGPAAPAAPAAAPAAGVGAALLGLPVALWLAAQRHHDAVLRELQLQAGGDPGWRHQVDRAERVRAALAVGVARAIGARGPASPVWVDEPVDVPLLLPPGTTATDARLLREVLDRGEELAREGRLLVPPALPEVVALTDWACDQLVAQLSGVPGTAWHAPEPAAAAPGDARVEAPADGVVVDDRHRVLGVDPALAAALGWQPEELLGERLSVLVPPAYRDAHIAGYTRNTTTGVSRVLGLDLDLPVLHRDGRELPAVVHVERTTRPGLRYVGTIRLREG